MPPIILKNGFKYFQHRDGRTSRVYKGLYADSLPITEVIPEPEDFREPTDAEFMTLMSNLKE